MIQLIVPVHNEETSLEFFLESFLKFKNEDLSNHQMKVLFIDDGSTDQTHTILNKLKSKYDFVETLTFAKNYGKEAALFAGIINSNADAVIPMDVDLQDPFEIIPKFINFWEQGSKMVVGKRIDRSDESIFKRTTAKIFYRSYNKFADIPIPENVGDFRLMDKEIVERISQMRESNKFMKGIFAYAGQVDAEVPYIRSSGIRTDENKPKQTFGKLLKLAEQAFSGAGTKFFRNLFGGTIILDFLLFVYASYIFYQKIVNHLPFQGFASITILITLASSVQITLLSFIGIIASKALSESQNRPSYFLENRHVQN